MSKDEGQGLELVQLMLFLQGGEELASLNSFHELKRLRNLCEDSDLPHFRGLEHQWSLLEETFEGCCPLERHKNECKDNNTEIGLVPISEFAAYVNNGFYPPPEYLILIAQCFQAYFLAKGELSLDSIFFPKSSKKGVGNFASQHWFDLSYVRFHRCVVIEKSRAQEEERKPKSLVELYENTRVFGGLDGPLHGQDDSCIDVDSFLRGYRRWKKRTGI